MESPVYKELLFDVIGPGKASLITNLKQDENYTFYFDVTRKEGKMIAFELTESFRRSTRTIIRREGETGITTIFPRKRIQMREARALFEPYWQKYLHGALFEDAMFDL